MNEITVSVLAGITVLAFGLAIMQLLAMRRESRAARRRVAGDYVPEDVAEYRVSRSLEKLGDKVTSGQYSDGLRQRLARAGYHNHRAAAVYLGTKVLLLLVGGATGASLALWLDLPLHFEIFLVAFLAVALFMVPNVAVGIRRDRRRNEVSRRLPDMVDLLEITVSSGMGLDMAWTSVADEIRRVSAVMGDEMELTSLEINLGVPRTRAMRHMANRTGAEDISSLVALLVQSERFGSSITDSLKVFARTMRETQCKRAEERAEKMAIKMLFPMVLFIFPSLLLVMVGPAVMNIIEVMS